MSFDVEDIYFMVGMSHRGEVVNLQGGGRIKGVLTILECIDVYYEKDTIR